jgi:hypothetical protein
MTIITLYALIALSLFGAGYGAAYKLEHSQINGLELQIKVSNEEARQKLIEATAATEAVEQAQIVTNTNLEIEHDKNIKSISDHANALESARRVWLNNQPSRSCTLSKADNPSINKDANATGYYLDSGAISIRVDGLIQKADTLSADHHEVMAWLNSLPPELLQ